MLEKTYVHPSGPRGEGTPLLKLRVYDSPEELSRGAAELFVEVAADEVRRKKHFNVVLSGGKTPEKFLEMVARPEFSSAVSWRNTYIFWGDERCVNLTHPECNYLLAHDLLLTKVEIPPENIFPMPGDLKEGGGFMYEEEIRCYFMTQEVRFFKVPAFDLIFLGLGKDGHTLSLFPEGSALGVQNRFVVDVKVEGADIPHRLTMTLPLVNHAKRAVFLVSGQEKARALYETITGPYEPRKRPAQGVKPDTGEMIFLVDKDAAQELL